MKNIRSIGRIAALLLLFAATVATAQVRPDQFAKENSLRDKNLGSYSQEGGVLRGFKVDSVMAQSFGIYQPIVTYVAPAGNPVVMRSKIVTDYKGRVFAVDFHGVSKILIDTLAYATTAALTEEAQTRAERDLILNQTKANLTALSDSTAALRNYTNQKTVLAVNTATQISRDYTDSAIPDVSGLQTKAKATADSLLWEYKNNYGSSVTEAEIARATAAEATKANTTDLTAETAARIAGDATKANITDLTTLQTNFTTLQNNVVRLLDAATAYVSPNGDNNIATIGDEFKPYQTPWDARNAIATAQKNGTVKKATIVVKKGEYAIGLTGSGANYTRNYLNNNSFNIDTLPFYAASPNSASLIVNNVTWEFRDGVQLGAKAGNYSCFVTTNKPDTCSILGIGTGAWMLEKTYNRFTSATTRNMSVSNDSAQISIITPNSDYINSFGWEGFWLRRYTNLAFNRVLVNRNRGIRVGGTARFQANSKPVFFRLKANLWSDTSSKYIAGWPTANENNECSIFQTTTISGADIRLDIGTAEVSMPSMYVRGGNPMYGINLLACDTSVISMEIGNLYQYRQFGKNSSYIMDVCDSIVKSDVSMKIGKAVTEGGFFKGNGWTGLNLKDTRVCFECANCVYQSSRYISDNTKPAFALQGTSTDTISTIRITGNYVIDSAQVFVISGSAPLNIIIKGNFISRSGKPIFEVNNVNARIIVESGSSLVTNGSNVVTGTSGAKIYFQSGVDYTGAISTVQLLTTKPTTWYF